MLGVSVAGGVLGVSVAGGHVRSHCWAKEEELPRTWNIFCWEETVKLVVASVPDAEMSMLSSDGREEEMSRCGQS